MDIENKECGVVTSLNNKVDFGDHEFEQYDTDLDDEHIFRKNTCSQCGQVVEEIYVLRRRFF